VMPPPVALQMYPENHGSSTKQMVNDMLTGC
jgi:hypothetical protein